MQSHSFALTLAVIDSSKCWPVLSVQGFECLVDLGLVEQARQVLVVSFDYLFRVSLSYLVAAVYSHAHELLLRGVCFQLQ